MDIPEVKFKQGIHQLNADSNMHRDKKKTMEP